MKRIPYTPRNNFKEILEKREGFLFHTVDNTPYWSETMEDPHYYQFNSTQIKEIDEAAESVHRLCLEAVEWVIKSKVLYIFDIPEYYWPLIEKSWEEDKEKDLYGRFDFSYDGVNPPKMLEYNADTPTSLFEAGFVQWNWMEDMRDEGKLPQNVDQYNRIQEDMIERFETLGQLSENKVWHFSCCEHVGLEDESTVFYMMDLANQAGLETVFSYVDQIGIGELETGEKVFVDAQDMSISNWFKLYPWEWLMEDEFGKEVSNVDVDMNIVEPLWKALLSNKAILPVLHYLNPEHKNILPAFFEDEYEGDFDNVVVKPILSREGANVQIKSSDVNIESEGEYDDCRKIVQAFHPLPNFDGNYPVVGVWMVGDTASGMSIREDDSAITKDTSRFMPHVIID